MTSLGAIVLAVFGVLSAIGAAWFAGKSKGSANEKVKAAEQRSKDNDEAAAEVVKDNQAAVEHQIKVVIESNEEEDAVRRLSDDDLFNELRNGPGRNPDHTSRR